MPVVVGNVPVIFAPLTYAVSPSTRSLAVAVASEVSKSSCVPVIFSPFT